MEGLEQHWPVQRLQWFSHGFYSVDRRDDAVVISDLRMGLEPNYVFQFKVAELANPHPRPVTSSLLPIARDWERLPLLWQRIRDSGTRFTETLKSSSN